MPRKPSISPTKITTFLACPLKYRWTYVDAQGKWYLRSKSYYSFGTTLHGVLQRFHDEGDTGVETVDQAIAAMEESWIDAGFSSAEEMQEAFGEGKEILERYVAAAKDRPRLAKTLFVEKMLRHDFAEFNLIGRLDRVDEYPDGSLEIVDYKSGRSTVLAEDVQNDLAMSVYQLLLKRKYPDRPVRATIVALKTGDQASYAMSDAELDEFERDIEMLGQQILFNTDFFEAVAVPKRLCYTCDFQPLCRKLPDFDLPPREIDASNR